MLLLSRKLNFGLFLINQSFIVHLCYFSVIPKHFHEFKKVKCYTRLKSLRFFTKTIESAATYNHMFIRGKSINFLLAY